MTEYVRLRREISSVCRHSVNASINKLTPIYYDYYVISCYQEHVQFLYFYQTELAYQQYERSACAIVYKESKIFSFILSQYDIALSCVTCILLLSAVK